jgi:surface antigen
MPWSTPVLAKCDRGASRWFLYNGTGASRLSHYLAAIAALLCGFAITGCSYQLHSLLSNDDTEVERTGTIARPVDQVATAADAAKPAEVDLAYARAVAAEVLSHGGKDLSVPWRNPETGAGGNITPLATSYTEAGSPCRDFLASYVHGGSQDWLQGAVCRTSAGNWEVKRLKSLSRS